MLAAILVLILLVAVLALAARLRRAEARLRTLERRFSLPLGEGRAGVPERPLHGVRIALDIDQDHPHPVFAALLRDVLLREGATLAEDGLTIVGAIVCNGYADVYFQADLTVRTATETLLILREKPPHGDRPGNLVLDLVERLKTELSKTERQIALRELP